MTVFFENLNIHPSWDAFLRDCEITNLLCDIQKQIGGDFTPKPQYALRFAETDLTRIKIIILGQDPYPQANIATGRAFEVGGLTSWQNKFPQSSLKNIIRAVYLAYHEKTLTFNDIRREITRGSFNILPPNLLFESWQAQGALLLNTTFTCKVNAAGSHIKIWEGFSNKLLAYISENTPGAIWFLWGRFAGAYERYSNGNRYLCNHPMLAGGRSDADFLNCGCFLETKSLINWKGL